MQENDIDDYMKKIEKERAAYDAKKFERYNYDRFRYNNVYKIKAVVVGDSNAGKSALLAKYIDNEFISEYECTFAINRLSKKVKSKKVLDFIKEDKFVEIDLWDTEGNKEYRVDPFECFNCARIIIIVVAASQESYQKVDQIRDYLNEFEGFNDRYNLPENKYTKVLVVETKIDLIKNHEWIHELTDAELQAVGSKIFSRVAVSAKTAENMDQFESVMDKIIEAVQNDYTRTLSLDPLSVQSLYYPPEHFQPNTLPKNRQSQYVRICQIIHSLNDTNAQGILVNLKRYLINGNLDREGVRYTILIGGVEYNTGDEKIIVPLQVKRILDKIDIYFVLRLKPAEFVLQVIYYDMQMAACSDHWVRMTSTQVFYEKYLLNYFETLVLGNQTVSKPGQLNRWEWGMSSLYNKARQATPPILAPQLKIAIVGNSGAGKTALLKRYFENTFYFDAKYPDKVAFHCYSKIVKTKIMNGVLDEERAVNIKTFDIVANDRRKYLVTMTNKGVYIVVIVIAANQELHEKINQIKLFLAEYSAGSDNNLPRFIVVETKVDLVKNNSLFHVLTDAELHGFKEKIFCHTALSSMTEENMVQFNSLMISAVHAVITDPNIQFELHGPKNLYYSFYESRGITHYYEHRIKKNEVFSKIWDLLDIHVKVILANIKQFLIKGDSDRTGQRYILSGEGEDYNTGDQVISVPKWVKTMLNDIDGSNKKLKTSKDILQHIYLGIIFGSDSLLMIYTPNTPSTLEFYSHFLPEYIEEQVLKYACILDEVRAQRGVVNNAESTAITKVNSPSGSQTVTVPESFSRSDNLTPRGEASALDELKPPKYDKKNPPIEPIETTSLSTRHYQYYGSFPRRY